MPLKWGVPRAVPYWEVTLRMLDRPKLSDSAPGRKDTEPFVGSLLVTPP